MVCFVHLLYRCTLANLTIGTDLRMNVFFWGFWYSGESMGLRKCVCGTFICVLLLQNNEFAPGGQKNGLFLSGERRQTVRDRLLGELWDYSTVSCWTLSWAGRLMWAKTSNAAQHLTKVKHFLSVSLPVSASRREICSGKSEMKCQEQSDCLGKGDPN